MLHKLQIHSFKAFSSGEIPIQPFTVLIGPNGSGKSTVLQALEFLGGLTRRTVREYLDEHGWEYSDLPHLRSRQQRFGVTAHLRLGDQDLRWHLELQTRRRPGIGKERITADGASLLQRDGRSMSRVDAKGRQEKITQTLTTSWLAALEPNYRTDRERFPELTRVARWARGIRGYYFLDPLRLRAPGRSRTVRDIGPSGGTLTAFLRWLSRHGSEGLRPVVERVQRHYHRLEALSVRKHEGRLHLEVRERWGKSSAVFNARQVSDGLLRLLAVAAMHELPDPPSVLLLDEIEDGLHPQMVAGVMGMLRELVQEREGATQVVVTTHSPLTVNACESGEEVLLVYRDARGRADVRPLSHAQGFEELRRHFDLGELWYNVGEDRLLSL